MGFFTRQADINTHMQVTFIATAMFLNIHTIHFYFGNH